VAASVAGGAVAGAAGAGEAALGLAAEDGAAGAGCAAVCELEFEERLQADKQARLRIAINPTKRRIVFLSMHWLF